MQNTNDRPQGWHHNPSAYSHRRFIAIVAAVGFLVSVYLTLYQWRQVNHMWDPIFGTGSWYILRESWLSKAILYQFQFPDAFFGAVAYFIEFLLATIGDEDRWRSIPWIAITQGLLGLAMAAASVALIVEQIVLGHGCMFCLVSAILSILIVGPAVDELIAAVEYLWRWRGNVSLWRSFWGTAH